MTRTKIAAICLAGVLSAQAASADEHYGNFFTTQPALEYVFDVAEVADMLTTLDIKNHPPTCRIVNEPLANGQRQDFNVCSGGMRELNPILGDHPSDGRIIATCVLAATLHAAVTYELVSQDVPAPVVRAWEYVSIGVEAGFAAHNYSIGLRARF